MLSLSAESVNPSSDSSTALAQPQISSTKISETLFFNHTVTLLLFLFVPACNIIIVYAPNLNHCNPDQAATNDEFMNAVNACTLKMSILPVSCSWLADCKKTLVCILFPAPPLVSFLIPCKTFCEHFSFVSGSEYCSYPRSVQRPHIFFYVVSIVINNMLCVYSCKADILRAPKYKVDMLIIAL